MISAVRVCDELLRAMQRLCFFLQVFDPCLEKFRCLLGRCRVDDDSVGEEIDTSSARLLNVGKELELFLDVVSAEAFEDIVTRQMGRPGLGRNVAVSRVGPLIVHGCY